MDRNIVRKHPSEIPSGILPITAPQNIPEGIFLHHLNSSGLPVLAEGILLVGDGKPTRPAYISRPFNLLEKNMIHGSHMIANRFGGSPKSYNLLALPGELNQREMGNFEDELALKPQTRKLYLQVFAAYFRPENQIPSDVLYRVYDVIEGKPVGISRDHSFLALRS